VVFIIIIVSLEPLIQYQKS